MHKQFIAIDFETATAKRASICEVEKESTIGLGMMRRCVRNYS